jgi:hypothetical protein
MFRSRRLVLFGLVAVVATAAIAFGAVAASSAVKPSFLITPTTLAFGPVATGTTSPSQAVTITNQSATSVVMAGSGGSLAAPFSADLSNCEGQTLAPGASCHMTYAFSPTDVGDSIATASGFWNGKKYSIKMSGTGATPTLSLTPTKLDFGPVLIGATAPTQAVTVTNVSTSPLLMSGTGLTVDPPYTLTEDCTGKLLNPGQSCHMTYGFHPTEAGRANEMSSPSWNGQANVINLTGSGVGPTLLITPTALQFGNVATGTNAPTQTVTVTNLSPFSLQMSGTGGGVSAPFTKTENCTGKTLSYGQSCQMIFGFHPTALGRVSATASGTWNGLAFNIKLLGTGA